jgi:nicotinamide mononucleotide transporter
MAPTLAACDKSVARTEDRRRPSVPVLRSAFDVPFGRSPFSFAGHRLENACGKISRLMNPYEAIGVLFGIVSVYLLARQQIWGWPFGLVNVALFIVVFYDARLYADAALQVVYVALCLYGWRTWLAGGRGERPLAPTRAPRRAVISSLALGGVSSLVIGVTIGRHTDASLPWVDAATTSFSLVAQWMQTRKWIETWWLWIVVDIVYVGMYVMKALYLTAGLYLVFLVLAGLGLVEWQKSLRRERPIRSLSS